MMLVQAMLNLIAHQADSTPSAQNIGLASMSEVPEPTGEFDAKTRHAILSYQRRYHRGLLSVDGVVHPASYRNRNIRYGRPQDRLMTITHFHWMLMNAPTLLAGQMTYTSQLLHKFQKLHPLLQPANGILQRLAVEIVRRLGQRLLGVLQRGLVVADRGVAACEADVDRPSVAKPLPVLLKDCHCLPGLALRE